MTRGYEAPIKEFEPKVLEDLLAALGKTRQEAIMESAAMLDSAKQDAKAIFDLLPGGQDDEEITLYQLLIANSEIARRLNFFSLIEFCNLLSSNKASHYGRKKHLPADEAKAFVKQEWTLKCDAHGRNKSEFARIYVRRVLNEFNVKVTEKQMREVWLKGTPPAGKPAG